MALVDDILELLGQVVTNLDFRCRRTPDHEIELGWALGDTLIADFVAANPTVVINRLRFHIQKTLKGYPFEPTYGITIYDSDVSGDAETVIDTEPIFGEVNYYTLYYKVQITILGSPMPGYPEIFYLNVLDFPGLLYGTKWSVTQFNTKYKIAEPFEWADKLYSPNFLPELYRKWDLEQDPIEPLKRYLQILGMEYEHLWDFLEELFHFSDPMLVDDALLESLGWNVGWVINQELPIQKQRLEIKRAVRAYKRKGTAIGLIELLEAICGWNISIISLYDWILFTDVIHSTTIDPADPVMMGNIGTPLDTVDYIIDDQVGWAFKLFAQAMYDCGMFDLCVAKMLKVIRMWLPICCAVHLYASPCLDDEGITIDIEHISDTLYSNGALAWLITTTDGKVSTHLAWRTPEAG